MTEITIIVVGCAVAIIASLIILCVQSHKRKQNLKESLKRTEELIEKQRSEREQAKLQREAALSENWKKTVLVKEYIIH